MFCHPALAVCSYRSGPPAAKLSESTGGIYQRYGSPCNIELELHDLILNAKDRKHSIKAVEWDLWQVYVSSSLGAAFNYACVALYFESAVLVAHPVPEVRVLHPWLSWGASRALLGFSLES